MTRVVRRAGNHLPNRKPKPQRRAQPGNRGPLPRSGLHAESEKAPVGLISKKIKTPQRQLPAGWRPCRACQGHTQRKQCARNEFRSQRAMPLPLHAGKACWPSQRPLARPSLAPCRRSEAGCCWRCSSRRTSPNLAPPYTWGMAQAAAWPSLPAPAPCCWWTAAQRSALPSSRCCWGPAADPRAQCPAAGALACLSLLDVCAGLPSPRFCKLQRSLHRPALESHKLYSKSDASPAGSRAV